MHSLRECHEMFLALMEAYKRKVVGDREVRILWRPNPSGIVGEFSPLGAPSRIGVVVLYPRMPLHPLRVLCTLCHELGHARSWWEGTRDDAYLLAHEEFKASVQAATPSSLLSPLVKRLIVDVERQDS